MCYSAGEYASPVWARSAHAKEVDVALNASCRIISGTLKPTPLSHVYTLSGIAPPSVRRNVASGVEKFKQTHDNRHLLHEQIPPLPRLKSRKSFLRQPSIAPRESARMRLAQWIAKYPPNPPDIVPAEKLPPGNDLPWAIWKSLNRLRAGVGRCRESRARWGFTANSLCDCGASQTMAHLLSCPNSPSTCTRQDLNEANDKAISVAKYWSKDI